MRVGRAAHTPGGTIRFGRYASGETAIEIMADYGEREAVATVSVVPYGAPDPGEHGVWLKGWSENEGIPEAMEKAGVVVLTGRRWRTGHAEAIHGTLTALALGAQKKQK